MEDVAKLDQLLERLHELSWVDDHLPQSGGSLFDRLTAIREQVRSEILSIVQSTTGDEANRTN